jgi:hypothetical protein
MRLPVLERVARTTWSKSCRAEWPLLLPAVGRRLRWRISRDPVSFVLQSLSVQPALSRRLRSVRLTVTDVLWSGVRLEQVHIVATGVRLHSAGVHAESVELRLQLAQEDLDELLESGLPYAKLHLDRDGFGRAELVSRPSWGHVELVPSVEEGGLVLLPQAVVDFQGRRWSVPARVLPRLRIGAEVLLPGARLTDARVWERRLHLTAEISDVDIPLRGRHDVPVVPALSA